MWNLLFIKTTSIGSFTTPFSPKCQILWGSISHLGTLNFEQISSIPKEFWVLVLADTLVAGAGNFSLHGRK